MSAFEEVLATVAILIIIQAILDFQAAAKHLEEIGRIGSFLASNYV